MTNDQFKEALSGFVEEMNKEVGTAAMLWSCLPSHQAALKHHGPSEAWSYCPSNSEVMEEAYHLIRNRLHGEPLAREEEGLFKCPCGEGEDR